MVTTQTTSFDLADEAALEQVLCEYGPVVRGTLLRKFGGVMSAEDVDDAMAIALNRLWTHRKQFDATRGSQKAWFFRIAHNVALDVLKHGWHKARQLEVAADSGFLEALPEPCNQTPVSIKAEVREMVQAALQELPELQRKIIWADALSPSGPASANLLAEELDIPAGTVRVYRKRAMDRLRKTFESQHLSFNRGDITG